MNNTTWRKLIDEHLKQHPGETVIDINDPDVLDIEFYAGYGSPEGYPFTAWTENRVLFPVCYDGAESVESAPRNPSGEATSHVGGY